MAVIDKRDRRYRDGARDGKEKILRPHHTGQPPPTAAPLVLH
jgi:hypothetical protein